MTPTRSQLYAWVWRIPLTEIAVLMDMSSSNVRKICANYRVPTPSRGFWRRFETGVTVTQDPLPNPEHDPPLEGYRVDEQALQAALDGARQGSLVLRQAPVETGEKQAAGAIARQGLGSSLVELGALAAAAPVVEARTAPEAAQAHLMSVSPTLSSVLDLADLDDRLQAAETLLARIRRNGDDCDPATRAVLALWLAHAETELRSASAVHVVQRTCVRIASGVEKPEWWVLATSGAQR